MKKRKKENNLILNEIDLNHPDPDFIKILKKYNLKFEFNEKTENNALKFQNFQIPEEEYRKRKDLRDIYTITMDSISAKDFDDAYSLEYKDNIFTLWVHIADVSYFIKKDSPLDLEAQERGNSYYLGPWVIHMLPPIFSENLCSLKEKEERLAFTCEMHLDKNGNIQDYDIYRSIIIVDKRIPYEIGNEILNNKDSENYEFLKLSAKLQNILYKKRIEEGSLQFDFPDYLYIFEENFITPKNIIKYDRGICERIVEEFMLVANKTIATFGSELRNFIYRIHDKPEEEFKNSKKNEFIKKGKLTNKKLNEILKSVKNTDNQYLVESIILKSLKRANYGNKNIGHFGLNFEKYTHFTSPIRRYADLITHRIILGEKYSDQELKKISILISMTEQIAQQAEDDYNKIKYSRFLIKYLYKTFTVKVVGIIPKGVFCRIEKYGCEGLLSSKKLKESGYSFNKSLNIYENKTENKQIKTGSTLNLILVKSDPDTGYIDFSFIKKEKRGDNVKKKKKRRRSGRYDSSD